MPLDVNLMIKLRLAQRLATSATERRPFDHALASPQELPDSLLGQVQTHDPI